MFDEDFEFSDLSLNFEFSKIVSPAPEEKKMIRGNPQNLSQNIRNFNK